MSTNKPYLILVDGKLAKRRKTYQFALKDKEDLEAKGYQKISIAYSVDKSIV